MKINYKGQKLLTILICCYKAEKHLKQCLNSLLRQRGIFPFYEILFINDYSPDRSLSIAQSYSKLLENFRIINNKNNLGVVKSCNLALRSIGTPFFMRLDADDFLSPAALGKITQELRANAKNDFIVFQRWDINGENLKRVKTSNDIFSWIAVGTVFRTQAVRSVGGYSNEFWEEYDLYLKLLDKSAQYKISPFRIYYYRRGHSSMTSDSRQSKDGFSRLFKKWGRGFINRHGNIAGALQYYGVK